MLSSVWGHDQAENHAATAISAPRPGTARLPQPSAPCPPRAADATTATRSPARRGAADRTSARLIRDFQHDLANIRTAFHQPMRRGRFGQRKGLENTRPSLAGFQHRPDFAGERCRDFPLLRCGAGTHGAASDSQALDHDRAQISFRLEATQEGDNH